jgi:hypothetical protein
MVKKKMQQLMLLLTALAVMTCGVSLAFAEDQAPQTKDPTQIQQKKAGQTSTNAARKAAAAKLKARRSAEAKKATTGGPAQ